MPVVAFKDRHRKATRKCGLKKIPAQRRAAVANRTVNGCFVKGESGNPRGRPKATPERRLEARARREVHRQVGNIVVEARKYSDSLPIFDAPRTFPKSNASHATIRLIQPEIWLLCEILGERRRPLPPLGSPPNATVAKKAR